MIISLLNRRITFQKSTVSTDSIGNHKNTWADYFACYATISGEGNTESEEASQTVDSSSCAFTVRWCPEISLIDSLNYRIKFNNELYNIIGIDHQNYKNKSIKFMTRKVRR